MIRTRSSTATPRRSSAKNRPGRRAVPRAIELRDRYGQAVSCSSPTAVERYMDALDRQLSLNAGAEAGFEAAIEADEGFALAHAGLAFARAYRGKVEAAKASSQRAGALAGGTSRR